MPVGKQIAVVVGVFVALLFLPGMVYSFAYGLVTGGEYEPIDALTYASIALAFGWLLLGIIYLTIGAAIRHNSRRE